MFSKTGLYCIAYMYWGTTATMQNKLEG